MKDAQKQVNMRIEFPRSLGIPRAQMPQISSEVVADFIKDLQDQGTAVRRRYEGISRLKPTQAELNMAKAKKMMGEPIEALSKPVMVSSDLYLLDGHHRWMALFMKDPDAKIEVYQVDLPIRELLARANAFGKVKYKSIGELREHVRELRRLLRRS